LNIELAELSAASGASQKQAQQGILNVAMTPVLAFNLGD
jgi:hypothetical protein